MIEVYFTKTHENAKNPFKKLEFDAGYDLYSAWMIETDKYVEHGTGLNFEIPNGFVGFICPRSSITNMDLIMKNSIGIIDSTFRGEIRIRFLKSFNDIYDYNSFQYTINEPVMTTITNDFITTNKILNRKPDFYGVGERICQLIIIELPKVKMIEKNKLSETLRGEQGFGHSGKF